MQRVTEPLFNYAAMRASVDGVRKSRGVTWRQVAEEAAVSASSISRMARGSRPDVETVAALAAWAGIDPAAFFGPIQRDPLAMATAYLRQDPQLTDEAADVLEQLVRTTYAQLSTSRTGSDRS